MTRRAQLVTFDESFFAAEPVPVSYTLTRKKAHDDQRLRHSRALVLAARDVNASRMQHLRADLLDDEDHVLGAYTPASVAVFLLSATLEMDAEAMAGHFGTTDPEAHLCAFTSPKFPFAALAFYGERPAPRLHFFWHGRSLRLSARITALSEPGQSPRDFARLLDPPMQL